MDPLKKGKATHSSILAWRIPWIEEPGGLQSVGLQRVRHDWPTNTHTHRVGWLNSNAIFVEISFSPKTSQERWSASVPSHEYGHGGIGMKLVPEWTLSLFLKHTHAITQKSEWKDILYVVVTDLCFAFI